MDWKVGDWAVFDRRVVQIKEIREGDSISVSDGHVEISGQLMHRLRPLTLRNKRIVEDFEILYKRLYQIRGENGFNYPDISRHFDALALEALDANDADCGAIYDRATKFAQLARDYTPVIQGVNLFRESSRASA